MALSTVMSEPVDRLTVAQIDREVKLLADALDTCASVDIATAYERRRQELLGARRMALVRERAAVREQQAREAEESRESFDALKNELQPALRARAVAIDGWIEAGRMLLEAYRADAQRLAAVEAVLVPPPVGRELHLPQLLERLTLDQSLEQNLALAGLLPAVSVFPWVREFPAQNTVEAHASAGLKRFFTEAAEWLPPVPSPDDDPGI